MSKAFFFQSIKNFSRVGAVWPSSAVLARKMTKILKKTKAQTVVELGAGTGIITREILASMSPDAKLWSFEVDSIFCEILKKEFFDPRIKIVSDCASKISQHVPGEIDFIFSGLPLLSFPAQKRKQILDAIEKALAPGGFYVQFNYSPTPLLSFKKYFSDIRIAFVPWNLPPAFVFICRKKVDK